jgi:hypothetical protein
MSSWKGLINYHKVNISVFIFLVIFSIIHFTKPALIYNTDGSFRDFGVGYRNKTVIPIWVVSIILAILSYLAVIYYLAYM